jgi:hypothetical protein
MRLDIGAVAEHIARCGLPYIVDGGVPFGPTPKLKPSEIATAKTMIEQGTRPRLYLGF